MAVGLPLKTTYADGDVYAASDVNDTNGTINTTAAPYAAGKNKIINGDFRVNQRGFTSNTTSSTYNFDRWRQGNGGTTGTLTITPETFTLGAAPVAGYEGSTFVQCVTASGASTNTFATIQQRLEDVRTFAGQTATISFWARAASGTPKIAIETEQFFGLGGSPSSAVTTVVGAMTLSTSWARYSLTVSVPSISGKTIGTNTNSSHLGIVLWLSAGSDWDTRASFIGLQNNTFQIWGVQVEAGSTATAFQTATGTIQGELAACQRYYFRQVSNAAGNAYVGNGHARNTTTDFVGLLQAPVEMRVVPTSVDYSTLKLTDGATSHTITALTIGGECNKITLKLNVTVASGLTAYRPYDISANSSSSAYLGFSAEL